MTVDNAGAREIDVVLETKEYKAWRASGKATRETCPLSIKSFESVRMIEKSAYDKVRSELEKHYKLLKDVTAERDEYRAQLEDNEWKVETPKPRGY